MIVYFKKDCFELYRELSSYQKFLGELGTDGGSKPRRVS